MARQWGIRTRSGKYVLIEMRDRLCSRCRAVEWVTTENGRFVSVTYTNGLPVLHKG